jgi:hypothetical protein
MTLLASTAQNFLELAIREELGVIIRVHYDDSVIDPIRKVEQQLGRFRRELGEDYRGVKIMTSPSDPTNEIWLVNMDGQRMKIPPHVLEVEARNASLREARTNFTIDDLDDDEGPI